MSQSTMRRSTWRVAGRRWGWLGLVPAVFALNMGLPEADRLPTGIPEALGCSGAPGVYPVPTWSELGPVLAAPADETGDPLPVTTDGFFVLRASTNGLSAEETQAQIRLRVTDATGVELAGELRLLVAEGWGYHAFAWSARAPLTIGERLNAVLSVDSSASGAAAVGGSFALTVVAAPPPLPEPQLELSRWGIFYQGTGDPLTCRTDLRCGSLTLPGQTVPVSVPGALEERLSAQVTWTPPGSSGFVAWRLRWQPEPAAAGDTAAEAGWYYWGFVRDHLALGRVNFPDRNAQHCASLVIEDLRSGETKSAQACAEPGPPELFQTDTLLSLCNEPPSAELTRAWCNLKSGTPPQCASLPAEENAPGTEVVTDAGTDQASGCQLGGSGSGQALGGATLAAVALYTAGRRRKRT